MLSAGDATWAISEHVAGSLDAMVTRMNLKAASLGMTDTLHCRRPGSNGFSSVAYSTSRDQAKLWESVHDDPAFLEFAGKASASICGTLNGNPICHPQVQPTTRSMNQYPSLEGSKTGGGGGLCPDIDAVANLPTCASGGCLVAQSNRLERPLFIAELQPSSLTGNRWPDGRILFDYGYRQLFTPDRRAIHSAGNTTAFGLDSISDSHALVAKLAGNTSVALCNWNTDATGGTLGPGACATHGIPSLAAGGVIPVPRMRATRISTLEADGDYLTGHLAGDELRLHLWRVGRR